MESKRSSELHMMTFGGKRKQKGGWSSNASVAHATTQHPYDAVTICHPPSKESPRNLLHASLVLSDPSVWNRHE